VNEAYDRASRYWSCEAYAALQELESGLELERFHLQDMLARVPPLPDRTIYGLIEESHPLESKWHVIGSKECGASGQPIPIPPVQLRWQIGAPTKVTLDGNSFRGWSEIGGLDQPNLLAILVLAWSYILSARQLELQGRDGSQMVYTESRAPLYWAQESMSSISVDVGDADSRTVRWFTAILAPGVGFQAARLQQGTSSHHAPWQLFLDAPMSPFSVKCEDGRKNLDLTGQEPPTSHEALQSLVALCNRHAVNRHQLHAALATALLLPTHNYLDIHQNLPRPETRNSEFAAAKLSSEDLEQLFNDLPYYITMSCGYDIINSSLCGIFWDPHVPCNLASPWLQPLWDLKIMEGIQGTPGRYAEVLALICARRAPNLAFLSIAAAISGLTSKILDQVSTGQPPLERHACAWTGVPQTFMDIAGEGRYFEMRYSKAYIRRSDCWRLRKLPPTVDDDLYYRIGPFTPWEPCGSALLENCPLRVQVHKDCDRHAVAYQGSTWYFADGRLLEHDLGKDSVTPHVFPGPFLECEGLDHFRFVGNEETSIDATIASFRWVLDNGEGRPPEDAYTDRWLRCVYDSDSDDDAISVEGSSSASETSRDIGSSVESCMEPKAWIYRVSPKLKENDVEHGMLEGIQGNQGKDGVEYAE